MRSSQTTMLADGAACFTAIPVAVIDAHLLVHLCCADVARLAQSCTTTRRMVDAADAGRCRSVLDELERLRSALQRCALSIVAALCRVDDDESSAVPPAFDTSGGRRKYCQYVGGGDGGGASSSGTAKWQSTLADIIAAPSWARVGWRSSGTAKWQSTLGDITVSPSGSRVCFPHDQLRALSEALRELPDGGGVRLGRDEALVSRQLDALEALMPPHRLPYKAILHMVWQTRYSDSDAAERPCLYAVIHNALAPNMHYGGADGSHVTELMLYVVRRVLDDGDDSADVALTLKIAFATALLDAAAMSVNDPGWARAVAAVLANRAIANVALSHFVRHIIMKLLVWNPCARSPFEMRGWALLQLLDPTGIEFTSSAGGVSSAVSRPGRCGFGAFPKWPGRSPARPVSGSSWGLDPRAGRYER